MKYDKHKNYFLGIMFIIYGVFVFFRDPNEFDDGRIYHIPVFLLLSIFGKIGTLLIQVLFGVFVIVFQVIKDKKQGGK